MLGPPTFTFSSHIFFLSSYATKDRICLCMYVHDIRSGLP